MIDTISNPFQVADASPELWMIETIGKPSNFMTRITAGQPMHIILKHQTG